METEGWEGMGQERSEGLCSGGLSMAGRLTGPFQVLMRAKLSLLTKGCDRTIWKKNHLRS